MVTRLTLDNLNDLYAPLEQLRQMFLMERPRLGSPSSVELHTLLRDGQAVAALSSYGYVLVHNGAWMGHPILFLDELYLHPQARKQGHFKELAEWLQGYCLFNGITAMLATTFQAEEARPLQTHLGATSVSMLMQIPVPNDRPLYISTYRPPVIVAPQPIPVIQPESKRKRQKKVKSASPQFLEQEPVIVTEAQGQSPLTQQEETWLKVAQVTTQMPPRPLSLQSTSQLEDNEEERIIRTGGVWDNGIALPRRAEEM